VRALAVALAAALAVALPVPIRSQTVPVLRVAYIAVDDEAEAMYAKDAGFFAKAGLNVELTPMENAGAISTAVASNSVEVGFLPSIVLAIAPQQEHPAGRDRAGFGVHAGRADHIAVRRARFADPQSERFKREDDCGSGPRIDRRIRRTHVDRKNGGDVSTVKFLEVPFPIMPEALNSGRVDAAMITEPFLTQAKKTERVLAATPFVAIAPEFAFGDWVANAQWAKDHADAVARFAAAMRETAQWANKNQAASGAVLQKYAKIDPALVATMSRSQYADRMVPATHQIVIDVAAKFRSFPSFPAAEMLDSR